MGKHLSVEEKLNASKEIEEIRAKLTELRREKSRIRYLLERKYIEPVRGDYVSRFAEVNREIEQLKSKRTKLENFLHNVKKSKYGGTYSKSGVCYRIFGKKRSELTIEEGRIYDRVMRLISEIKS